MRLRRAMSLSVIGLAAVGLAAWAGFLYYTEHARVIFSENVILREASRPESVWRITGPPENSLIRVRNGRFAGWYLAADESILSFDAIPVEQMSWGFVSGKQPPYVRNLYLRRTRGEDCYWRIVPSAEGGSYIQAKSTRYRNWYLDYLTEFVPEEEGEARTAWSLALHANPQPSSRWRITRTKDGSLIQAANETFAGWYLDHLLAANVLEKRRAEAPRFRTGQTPPLACRVPIER